MEHLALEIFNLDGSGESKYAYLESNARITITDTSELFGSGDVWTHSFTLNTVANAHIFGSSGEIHGSRLHDSIHKRKARLWVEGLPMFLGYLKLDSEAEVDDEGNVSVTFEGGQKTFDDLISGAKANQVPMMDDVCFGLALYRERSVSFSFKANVAVDFGGKNGQTEADIIPSYNDADRKDRGEIHVYTDPTDSLHCAQAYPRMVFPKGSFVEVDAENYSHTTDIDYLNVDQPYMDGGTPYCNVALCYQKQGYKEDVNGNVDYTSEPEAKREYELMPANRVNSAPNFFVIYWIKSLMKHLDISIEENEMMDMEDLRRLFFVNTKCAYKEFDGVVWNKDYDSRFGRYKFLKRLIPEDFDSQPLIILGKNGSSDTEATKLECYWFELGEPTYTLPQGTETQIGNSEVIAALEDFKEIKKISINVKDAGWSVLSGTAQKNDYLLNNNYLYKAIATGDCFPDVNIDEVISMLENSFGIRFLFSSDYKKVRIVLMRNIFRNKEVQDISCDIISSNKVENNIRGFRMTFGDNDDTAFCYKGFDDMLAKTDDQTLWVDNSDTHDYSNWNLNADYAKLKNSVSAFDKTCYVTRNNGNAYGIKVDKDAKTYDDLHPSLFEFAGYMDAEDGDCSGDEDTVEEINVGFTPAIMNDLNNGSGEQRFALFVDETMRPRRLDLGDLADGKSYNDSDAYYDVSKLKDDAYPKVDGVVKPGEFCITSDIYYDSIPKSNEHKLKAKLEKTLSFKSGRYGIKVSWDLLLELEGHFNAGYRLYLQDNFEPNDDGVCPIETHDWGLTLGIMRGSGSDMHLQYEYDPNDNEGNNTWYVVPGSNSIAHPDTCDSYGNIFDYNGDQSGVGDMEGRFSLKLRAEKPNPLYKESSTNDKYLEITNSQLRRRGLADVFYTEYSYWVRNARIAKKEVRMELAQLLAIDKTKRVRIGDVTGFIKKMQYSVSNDGGLGIVTMEIMYI